jgi:outer membrane protein OmpA-like peptidoglycan-associated protein
MAQAPEKALKYYTEAEAFRQRTQYVEAIDALNKAIEIYPDYLDAKILLGEIYFTTKKYTDCIAILENAKDNIKTIYPSIYQTKMYWQLADAYLINRNFEKCIENANLYLAQNKKTEFGVQKAAKLIETATFSKQAVANPVNYKLTNLSININTDFDEYFPALTPDSKQLYFTRRTNNQEDIYYSEKINNTWTKAQLLDEKVNTSFYNEGSQSISANGNLLFFTTCNRPNVFGSCDIFYTYFDGKSWTAATGINKPINTPYWDAQPSFSADGKAMYFSSDRPNGLGGKDIWVSYLDEQLRWSEPKNLGEPVNTPQDEQTPFIHPDGKTLYFASNGHTGMGMNDIFMSKFENGQWTKPANLGYPVNTERDEMGLFVSTEGDKAYFASSRPEGLGKLDIYEFDLPQAFKPQPTTYVKTYIKNARTKAPLFSQYSIIDINTNEIVNKGNTNSEGSFTVCLDAHKNYALMVQKENFLLHTENFSFKAGTIFQPYLLEIELQPIEKNSQMVLNNIFYETNSAALSSSSYAELDKLYDFLNQNKQVKVEIGGHTDDVGGTDYNQYLSQKRAQNVVDYLVQKGIAPTRLIAQGYADTQPVAPNTSAENRAKNRRTVLVILSTE